MKNWLKKIILLLLFLIQNAFSSELDNCILSGLRGVNSDAAARMVQKACENKIETQKDSQISSQYGNPINLEMKLSDWKILIYGSQKNISAKFTNNSILTAMYVEISIAASDESGICPESWAYKKFVYEVQIKPERVGTFLLTDVENFINKENDNSCFLGVALRGRPPKLLDSNFTTYTPLSDLEVKIINTKLNSGYGITIGRSAAAAAPLAGTGYVFYVDKAIADFKKKIKK